MRYYAYGLERQTDDTLQTALGSFGVIIIDGRLNLFNALEQARDWALGRNFAGVELHKGERLGTATKVDWDVFPQEWVR